MIDYLATQVELKLNCWSFYNKKRVLEEIDMEVYQISIGFKNMNILLNKKETSMKTPTNRWKSGGWNGDKLLEPIVLCYRTAPLKENEIFYKVEVWLVIHFWIHVLSWLEIILKKWM